MRWLVLGFALLVSPAATAQTVDELRAEVENRVARNNWQAADRAFRALSEQSRPTARESFLGGQAAQALGLVNAAHDRYATAVKSDKKEPSYAEALDALLATYGTVQLKLRGEGALRSKEVPTDAAPRRLIEDARRSLLDDGRYAGLLPVGTYTLGNQPFEVVAGERTKVSAK